MQSIEFAKGSFVGHPNKRMSCWDPRSLPKQAAAFDLPITLGTLAGSGQNKSGSDRQR